MKLSELILELQDKQKVYGDLDIFHADMKAGAPVEVVTPNQVEDIKEHPNGYIIIGG